MLLTHRKLLQSKAIAIENDLRGTLRNFVGIRLWRKQRYFASDAVDFVLAPRFFPRFDSGHSSFA